MYTKKEAHELLGVSKNTLYKHMDKLGINKGKKLDEKDMKALKVSTKKTKKNTMNVDMYIDEISELKIQINSLLVNIADQDDKLKKMELKNKEIDLLKQEKIKLEIDNRNLFTELQNSLIVNSNLVSQNAEFLTKNQKLLESKNKKPFWKR